MQYDIRIQQNSTIMEFFTWEHLTHPRMQEVSKRFAEMAEYLEKTLTPGPEKAVALRKLLEGKDAAVRTVVADLNREKINVNRTPGSTIDKLA